MDRRINRPNIADRHPRPAEMMRMIEEQNRTNNGVSPAPTLQEQLSHQATIYAAVNAPHNTKLRRRV